MDGIIDGWEQCKTPHIYVVSSADNPSPATGYCGEVANVTLTAFATLFALNLYAHGRTPNMELTFACF
jgi:hypothetical protein